MADKIYNKLSRLYFILNKLRSSEASKEELMQFLTEANMPVETATFERDKKTLKDDFGIVLHYNKTERNYTLQELDKGQLAQAIQFLQIHQLSAALNQPRFDRNTSLDFIEFENENQLNGIEYLESLFLATKQHQIIKLKHRRFETPNAITYTLKPYLIKQYQSRWYVVGETNNTVKTFGIDRIEDLELTGDYFKPDSKNHKDRFMNCIGVSYINGKIERVKIAFDISQKEYLDKLPLHHSQSLVEENENNVEYEYFLVNNFELRQHILKYGHLAKVLFPPSLANAIKEDLKKAFEAY
jgi:predicted DNA-binding transcriptional regulator YafY